MLMKMTHACHDGTVNDWEAICKMVGRFQKFACTNTYVHHLCNSAANMRRRAVGGAGEQRRRVGLGRSGLQK